MDSTTGVTIGASVLLGVAGYIATYAYSLRLAQRKDRLDRVSHQLSDFYGPLLAARSASQTSWDAFRTLYRSDNPSYWGGSPPPSADEAAAWRLWITEVFMPLNEALVDVITKHADLLDESEMPQCLLDACAHVAAYRPVIKNWAKGDFSVHVSVIDFPSAEVFSFVRDGFARLKAEQRTLLGK